MGSFDFGLRLRVVSSNIGNFCIFPIAKYFHSPTIPCLCHSVGFLEFRVRRKFSSIRSQPFKHALKSTVLTSDTERTHPVQTKHIYISFLAIQPADFSYQRDQFGVFGEPKNSRLVSVMKPPL